MSADLTSLLRSTHISNHEDVLKAANNSLKKSKSDTTAQHARITALLKLDRYDDAVRAFEEYSALKDSAQLEYAYALYKAGKLDEAAKVAQKADSRGLKHVLAQTTYRLEKFGTAQSLYKELADKSSEAEGEANDLRINGAAVDAQLEWSGKGHLVTKKQPSREDLEAFESAYNAACGAVARGELGKAEVLLRRARDLCLASEELSEEEKKAEMVPLTTQMAYVLLRLGRAADARNVAADLHGEGVDEATKWIGRVNELVVDAEAGEGANPYLTHRIFSSGKTLVGTDTPFKYQTDILHQNSVITALLSSKHEGVKRSTANVLEDNDEPTTSPAQNSLSVLNAAAHAKGQSSKAGLKAVLPLLEERPTDVGLLLTIVHLYCLTNNHGSAISLLESFFARLSAKGKNSKNYADVRHAPGLVAVLVSLYTKQNRTAGVKTELSKAASYWRSRRKDDSSIPLPVSLLRAAGTALLASGSENEADAKEAAEIFRDLHDLDPNDRASTAGLIASLALTSSPDSIPQDLLKSLTPSARLTADLDPLALENGGIPHLTPPTPSSKKRAAPTTDSSKKKRSKLSKKRTPKGYDPSKPNEDKERWLPLRDRSYWRPKGGKKGKGRANNNKGADLTQGGVVDESLGGSQVVKGGSLVVQGGGKTGNKQKGKKKR
jgi:signal recognition particle subunit SRP72